MTNEHVFMIWNILSNLLDIVKICKLIMLLHQKHMTSLGMKWNRISNVVLEMREVLSSQMRCCICHYISFHSSVSDLFFMPHLFTFTIFPSFSTLVFLSLYVCAILCQFIWRWALPPFSIDNFFPFHCANKT